MIRLRLGFVPLTDCAVLAVAHEKGHFRRQGIDAELTREVSWANVRDKLATGAIDGAHMLAAMPIASTLGLDPVGVATVTSFSLGLNGNAVTVSEALWARMRAADPDAMAARRLHGRALAQVVAEDRRAGSRPLRLATVHPFSPHSYELRYWLAAWGIDPERDVDLCVVPPPRMVECLEQRRIDGFCVGEPWGSLAVRRGRGHIATTKLEIWSNSPDKVFALRRDWAERHPELHRALLRALLEAAVWADDAGNREELAYLLASERYVGGSAADLAPSLAGRMVTSREAEPLCMPDFHVFHRYAASFPFASHAAWMIVQMLRWGQIVEPIDVLRTARSVYRAGPFREAACDLGLAVPESDVKYEGAHAGPWTLPTSSGEEIAMGRDVFCDGRCFDPRSPAEYLAGSPVHALRVPLDALAAAQR